MHWRSFHDKVFWYFSYRFIMIHWDTVTVIGSSQFDFTYYVVISHDDNRTKICIAAETSLGPRYFAQWKRPRTQINVLSVKGGQDCGHWNWWNALGRGDNCSLFFACSCSRWKIGRSQTSFLHSVRRPPSRLWLVWNSVSKHLGLGIEKSTYLQHSKTIFPSSGRNCLDWFDQTAWWNPTCQAWAGTTHQKKGGEEETCSNFQSGSVVNESIC